jgi:CubicO group peptidase (beta-lactamase class C family)
MSRYIWLGSYPRYLLPLILLVGHSASICAQDGAAAKVEEYVKAEMQRQRIPGLSLAVIKNGEITLAKGYGFANLEHQVPVKPETIFQSGSMGKQFTATAVMMLVEAGKLNLSDPITNYFPDAPAGWSKITVRHLLTHTGGTTDYPRDFDFRRDYTEADLLKRAEAIPLAFQPGEKWSYSNLGYVLLGILIHKVSGEFYGDYLQARVFRPLGMSTARIISEEDIVPNRAAGYQLVKGEVKNQEWVSPSLNTTADGALYFTVYDLAKWDAALYTEKLLKRSSLDQMWTPVKLNDGKTIPYGFGWSLNQVRGHQIIEHGGAWQGFKSHIARYVDDQLTIVVFANLSQANPGRIAHGIAAIYNPELAPEPPKAIEDKEPQVTSLARDVIRRATDGSLDANLFTAEAWTEISRNTAQVSTFLKPLGPLNAVELLERNEADGNHRYRYRLRYKDTNLFFVVSLNSKGKITGLNLQPE